MIAFMAALALALALRLSSATEEFEFCIGGQVSTAVSDPSGLKTCCDTSCATCEWKGDGPQTSCYSASLNAFGKGSLSWRLSTEEQEAGGRLCRHSSDRGCLIEKQLWVCETDRLSSSARSCIICFIIIIHASLMARFILRSMVNQMHGGHVVHACHERAAILLPCALRRL